MAMSVCGRSGPRTTNQTTNQQKDNTMHTAIHLNAADVCEAARIVSSVRLPRQVNNGFPDFIGDVLRRFEDRFRDDGLTEIASEDLRALARELERMSWDPATDVPRVIRICGESMIANLSEPMIARLVDTLAAAELWYEYYNIAMA